LIENLTLFLGGVSGSMLVVRRVSGSMLIVRRVGGHETFSDTSESDKSSRVSLYGFAVRSTAVGEVGTIQATGYPGTQEWYCIV
jgi:hypothetical protein